MSAIPPTIIQGNQVVVDLMREASVSALAARESMASGDLAAARSAVEHALEAATQARDGAQALYRNQSSLLEPTLLRYSTHATRTMDSALRALGREDLSADGHAILERRLFDGEVQTRLAAEAGDRSLARPRPHKLPTPPAGSGNSPTGAGGPAWVDGQWLDALGNPARGSGGAWVGPDGQAFDSMGNPASRGSGSWTGPDGVSYSGI